MTKQLRYGAAAKAFHWTIVALLVMQYPVGWLMPDIHGGMKPGAGMTFHVSTGLVILAATVFRFAWRLIHPVSPESTLPGWQRLWSEVVHWMLYVMVLLTTLSGWLFASFGGWSMSFFYLLPLPMLSGANPAAIKSIDGLHQAAEWMLLVLIVVHVGAALLHLLHYRDGVMRRMLPG
jgi:cytochrome b561